MDMRPERSPKILIREDRDWDGGFWIIGDITDIPPIEGDFVMHYPDGKTPLIWGDRPSHYSIQILNNKTVSIEIYDSLPEFDLSQFNKVASFNVDINGKFLYFRDILNLYSDETKYPCLEISNPNATVDVYVDSFDHDHCYTEADTWLLVIHAF